MPSFLLDQPLMRKMSSTHSLLHRVSSMLLFTLLLIIDRVCASSLSIDSYSGSGSLAQEECSTENCRLPVERRLTSLSALGISSDVSWKQKYFIEALHGYRVKTSLKHCMDIELEYPTVNVKCQPVFVSVLLLSLSMSHSCSLSNVHLRQTWWDSVSCVVC